MHLSHHQSATRIELRRNESVMRCIKHSMMFEAQITAVYLRGEKGKFRDECREREEERTPPVLECGDFAPVVKPLVSDYVLNNMLDRVVPLT